MLVSKIGKIRVFYDGDCGFCNAFIRFIATKMGKSERFLFSPLEGKTFQMIKKSIHSKIPDSIIVYSEVDGKVLYKMEAVSCILKALNSPWRCVGYAISSVPLQFANFLYDRFAKIRHKFGGKSSSACSLIPKELRVFFED